MRVIDSGGLSDQGTFKLTVENVNNPPEFSSIPVLFGIQDEPYSYQVVAKDKDKDDFLSLDATIPSWLSFDISTGYLTGIPSNEDIWAGKTISYNEQIASEFPVNIITTDRYGASSEQNFTITVIDLNDSPILGDFVFDEENSGFNVQAGDLVNQALYISDPDKVDTSFQIVTFDAPDWLVLYNMTGLVDEDAGYSHRIIAPTSIENIGSYPITISVEDERGAFSEKTYELIVEDNSVILEKFCAGARENK